ncbi:hypothetical protein TVAG_070690 [Trichomonas vaginalis G3]|uniref:Uncharacterized protein n=1 Tax=Trichomonas vaginalis (strain ATCC PRA-98 / G3) TaxID=412133 RepID=A2D7X3_TRIV3|nr:hypothetical protein TVAGG3_1045270 [Trichomonas vaginalis G3]EAY23406.1 hypothetical protein TVAG_070690 [Trichomonas vaginalis G3]KAI5493819.1 hypothetical protein TVAGG3_1045270 [Trichomonas vaginalis G3]|eukprot:XP_001584392.1 hypothetical protein [Trichomonas vaginalis G3]
MIGLIVLGICAAMALTGKICQSVRDGMVVKQVGYVAPGKSFENLISASTNQKFTVKMSKGPAVISAIIQRLKIFVPASLQKQIPEVEAMLKAMADLGGYELETAHKALMLATYNPDNSKLGIFNVVFTPISDDLMTVQLYDLTANFKMPTSFMIAETTISNKWRTKTEQSLVAKPREITPQAVTDAIAMCIAPCLNGDIDMPKEIRDLYAAKNQAENPGLQNIQTSFK